ncbi:MAG: glycosyltransferase [Ignavibacteria bacterium]|nr:glycosyltransferase [Ignavibacteria bacterium]
MISVIIPTLNEEKLLEQMLRQFTPEIARKYDIELVVSDGGSVDSTMAIARRFAAIVIGKSGSDKQTIAEGRNIGALQSHGEILVFLNADTLIRDVGRFFMRITEELLRDKVAALTCSVEVYPHEVRITDKVYHGFYNWLFRLMNSVGMGMGRGECHIIRRDVFQAVDGYAPEIAAGEDYEMFRRLRRKGRIRFLKDVVVYESPRRYRKYGYLYVTASWFVNFLSVFFLGKSLLREWKPVR